MLVYDELYGEFHVDEVIEELLRSKPVQRLNGVHQGGASYLVNKKWNVTRYDHSVGVMLLIKRLGGSVEEQIAALLHDVSHTAFSHVIDFVYENQNEDYHEEIFRKVIKHSEIPAILAKYEYDYELLLFDEARWTLLEQPAPELCADRVDYTLRDMYEYGHITLEEAQRFLNEVVVVNGKMYVQTIEMAEWFVETYYNEVIGFFMDPLNIYGYDRLANILKVALQKNIISKDDFLEEDEMLLQKIKQSKDTELLTLLDTLNEDVRVEENEEEYDLHRKTKLRQIDPSIFIKHELMAVSQLSERVRNLEKTAYEKATKGVFVKVIST